MKKWRTRKRIQNKFVFTFQINWKWDECIQIYVEKVKKYLSIDANICECECEV